MFSNKKLHIKFIKYIGVGAAAFAVEYGTFVGLIYLWNLPLVIVQSLSFLLGLTVSFLGSRFITFSVGEEESHSLGVSSQIVSFLSLGLFNLLVSNIILHLLVNDMHLHKFVAKIAVMALVALWNYLIFNRFIFKPQR